MELCSNKVNEVLKIHLKKISTHTALAASHDTKKQLVKENPLISICVLFLLSETSLV